jgi:hypothetical protein
MWKKNYNNSLFLIEFNMEIMQMAKKRKRKLNTNVIA